MIYFKKVFFNDYKNYIFEKHSFFLENECYAFEKSKNHFVHVQKDIPTLDTRHVTVNNNIINDVKYLKDTLQCYYYHLSAVSASILPCPPLAYT